MTIKTTTWIQTASNTKIDFSNPDPSAFNIKDIALALSRQPRYGGHGKFFYSVAQHSTLVATQVPINLRLHALLHDAHEAYTGDIAGPLKELLGLPILDVEWRLQQALYVALDLPWPSSEEWETIYNADKAMLKPEYCVLFDKHMWQIGETQPVTETMVIEKLTQKEVEEGFLAYYSALNGRFPMELRPSSIRLEQLGTWQDQGPYGGFYA